MSRFERKAQSQPKHGPPSVSSASKASAPLPSRRPDWNGSGYTKKAVRRRPATTVSAQGPTATVQEQVIQTQLQQLVLDTIRTTFPASDDFDALRPALRDIKDAIAQHDFDKAFATEESLETYTIRWTPSRALAYANVLASLLQEISEDAWVERCTRPDGQKPAKVVSIGRGVAEFMAIAAVLKHLQPHKEDETSEPQSDSPDMEGKEHDSSSTSNSYPQLRSAPLFEHAVADVTDWSDVISKLHDSLTTPRPLSKYASAKARASNAATISPQGLKWSATKLDVLHSEPQHLSAMIGTDPALVTLCFTLSELYPRSLPKTTKLLRQLTVAAPRGTLLLVIDHIEAPVTTLVGRDESEQQEKTYPLHWLFSQTLLPRRDHYTKGSEGIPKPMWEKLVEDQNRVFKLPAGLRFPGSLENIKYQIHILRRL